MYFQSSFFVLQSRGVSLCHSFSLLFSRSLCFYFCPLITSCLSLFSNSGAELRLELPVDLFSGFFKIIFTTQIPLDVIAHFCNTDSKHESEYWVSDLN